MFALPCLHVNVSPVGIAVGAIVIISQEARP